MLERNATKSKNKYEMDMCTGPFLQKILIFYIPLMLSNVLQLLFNAADMVVVGRYAGNASLAAVGSTSSLTNLLVNLFIGLSIGANVLVARYYSSGQKEELSDMVHTTIAVSLISGILLIFIGIGIARPVLLLMGTPDNVIDKSVLYMTVYFLGMPFTMTYNFGAAVLRAIGDTKRPLYYLLFSGVINVILNLFFVIGLSMDVAGVALATVISQAISAIFVLRCLWKSEGAYRLDFKKLKCCPDKVFKMFQIGLPAGLQSCLFSLSNILIQSSVNSFGDITMAGNTASSSIENFVYASMNSFSTTMISFAGQNYGVKAYKNIKKTLLICEALVIGVGLVMGNAAFYFSKYLLGFYSTDLEVIYYGTLRMSVICTTYCLCGMMDVMVGALRGMGHSIVPMIVSLSGACLFRIIWIFTIFQKTHSLIVLYSSYPISWFLTFCAHVICFTIIYRKLMKQNS